MNSNLGQIKHLNIRNKKNLSGDWYLFEVNCVPPKEYIERVVIDILNENDLVIENGKLFGTSEESKIIKLGKKKSRVINELKPQTYKIALFDNLEKGILGGQPLAFAIDPQINHIIYPHHNHLNSLNNTSFYKHGATICYTANPELLSEKIGNRLEEAIAEVIIWLFRHQFWEKYYEIYGEKLWIGPEMKNDFPAGVYLQILNPKGKCRCGRNKLYKDCCMSDDFSNSKNDKLMLVKSLPNKFDYNTVSMYQENFNNNIIAIEKNVIDLFKDKF